MFDLREPVNRNAIWRRSVRVVWRAGWPYRTCVPSVPACAGRATSCASRLARNLRCSRSPDELLQGLTRNESASPREKDVGNRDDQRRQ